MTKNYNYYMTRTKQSFMDLMAAAQFRLSFYNIFYLTDSVDLVKLKTKKVRNQVKIIRDRLETTQEINKSEVDELKKKYESLENLFHNFQS